jgi:hypothetical protein
MPTKRVRTSRTTTGQITAEACTAWRAGDFHELNRLLKFFPFEHSPFDAGGPPPERTGNPFYDKTWPRAAEMRRQLIEAAGEPGRMDQHGRPLDG